MLIIPEIYLECSVLPQILLFLVFVSWPICLKLITFPNLHVASLAFSIGFLLHQNCATYKGCILKISGSRLRTMSINLHFTEANCQNSFPRRDSLMSKVPNYSMTTQVCDRQRSTGNGGNLVATMLTSSPQLSEAGFCGWTSNLTP